MAFARAVGSGLPCTEHSLRRAESPLQRLQRGLARPTALLRSSRLRFASAAPRPGRFANPAARPGAVPAGFGWCGSRKRLLMHRTGGRTFRRAPIDALHQARPLPGQPSMRSGHAPARGIPGSEPMTLASCTAASAASRPLFDGPSPARRGGLLQRVRGQNPERHRHARGLRRGRDRVRDGRRQVVEVRRLSPDDAPETDDRIECPRFGGAARGQRDLERSRNLDDRHGAGAVGSRAAGAGIPERGQGPVAQRAGDGPMVRGYDQTDPQTRSVGRPLDYRGVSHEPLKRAGRFSRKAAVPSRQSLVAAASPKRPASWAQPSTSVMPSPSRTAART